MWFHSLFQWPRFAQATGRRTRREAVHRRPMIARPRLERLEDRWLPSFVLAGDYPVGGGPVGPAVEVVVADFNVDGILDQVAGNTCLLGNGDGTFRYASSWVGGEAVADFNLDGFPDIASRAGYVLLGNGDGTFDPGYGGAYGYYSIAAGDLNNDGNPDVIVGSGYGDSWYGSSASLSIVYGNGDGTFGPPISVDLGPFFFGNPSSLALADLDGDGLLDVVVANADRYSDPIQVLVMESSGGRFELFCGNFYGVPDSLALGDVNGDSHPDIVLANSDIFVSLNTGNGGFAGPVAYAAGDNTHSPALADINGDGFVDLAVTDGDGVAVLLGLGNGTFDAPQHFATSGPAFDLAAGDFNGDGYADLTVAVGFAADPYEDGYAAEVLINDGAWALPRPSVSISDVTTSEGNDGTQAVTFTVSLSATTSQTVTVAYATANGTAI